MQPLRNIGIIGRITMLEGARKQVFHVLMLFAMFLIFGSASLAKFDQHVQMKMLNDLCLFCVFLVSSVVAITITVTGIPGEMEHKTVYPVIAKPVARWQFICGKYAGAMGTVAIGMAIMAATFVFLQLFYAGHLDRAMLYVLPFMYIETAILAALALWLSTWASWPLAWFLSVLLCLLGNAKYPLYDSLMSRPQSGLNRLAINTIYHLLPNLESFNFKDAMVHHLIVPNLYLWQTATYGVFYTAAVLTLASLTFARKEL